MEIEIQVPKLFSEQEASGKNWTNQRLKKKKKKRLQIIIEKLKRKRKDQIGYLNIPSGSNGAWHQEGKSSATWPLLEIWHSCEDDIHMSWLQTVGKNSYTLKLPSKSYLQVSVARFCIQVTNTKNITIYHSSSIAGRSKFPSCRTCQLISSFPQRWRLLVS